MTEGEAMRALVTQLLAAAAEEIFGLFERSTAEHEEQLGRLKEENERIQKQLDSVLKKPPVPLQTTDVKLLAVIKHENQDIEVPFTAVLVRTEEEQEKPQSSQPLHRHTEQMETAADGEDCGGHLQPARNSHPETHLQPENEVSPEQQEGSPSLDQEPPEPPHITEVQMELVTPVPVKSEAGEEKPQNREPAAGHPIGQQETILTQNMVIHKGKKRFSCSACRKRFTRKLNLTRHMVVHTREKRFSCSVCEQSFTQEKQLKRHKCAGLRSSELQQDHSDQNTEAEPGASSSTGQINRHIQEEEEELSISVPEKTEDDEEEPQSSQPQTEEQIEESSVAEIEVNVDDREESREPEVREKPQSSEPHHITSCSLCGKRFKWKRNLKRHMTLHTGVRTFSCSVCGETFDIKSNFLEHMAAHTGEKRFSCSVCSQRFTRKGSLTAHMVVHTGERNFRCTVCDKTFNKKFNLKEHMTVHTRVKKFSCSLCTQSFTRRNGLTRHMDTHTGKKRISCTGCERTFAWYEQLKRHKCGSGCASQLQQNHTEQNREGDSSETEDSDDY